MNDVGLVPRQFVKTLRIVGVACGLGAHDRRCDDEQGNGFESTDSFQGIRCPQE